MKQILLIAITALQLQFIQASVNSYYIGCLDQHVDNEESQLLCHYKKKVFEQELQLKLKENKINP